MANLFERSGLQQDTGLISERWGQDGSVIVNVTEGVAADETIYTVTSGKVLYVTDLVCQFVTSGGGANDYAYIVDTPGSPTNKFLLDARSYSGGEVLTFVFKTPVKFVEAVKWLLNPSASVTAFITFSGWEESA